MLLVMFAAYYAQNLNFLNLVEDSNVGRTVQEGQYNGKEDRAY